MMVATFTSTEFGRKQIFYLWFADMNKTIKTIIYIFLVCFPEKSGHSNPEQISKYFEYSGSAQPITNICLHCCHLHFKKLQKGQKKNLPDVLSAKSRLQASSNFCHSLDVYENDTIFQEKELNIALCRPHKSNIWSTLSILRKVFMHSMCRASFTWLPSYLANSSLPVYCYYCSQILFCASPYYFEFFGKKEVAGIWFKDFSLPYRDLKQRNMFSIKMGKHTQHNKEKGKGLKSPRLASTFR